MSKRVIGAGVLLAAVAVSVPALAFDSVEEALCVCVDDVLNTGDYVSCVSHMTRRLVATDLIDNRERSALVRAASATDLPALQDECAASTAPAGMEGWGVSLQIDRVFHPAPSPSGPTGGVFATLRLWNMSRDDIAQTTPVFPSGEGCEFLVRLLDGQDRLVREVGVGCVEVISELDMLVGDVLEHEFLVPLLAENADPATGLLDGQKLPAGVYRLEVTWNAHGPQKPVHAPAMDGGFPTAVITLRVG